MIPFPVSIRNYKRSLRPHIATLVYPFVLLVIQATHYGMLQSCSVTHRSFLSSSTIKSTNRLLSSVVLSVDPKSDVQRTKNKLSLWCSFFDALTTYFDIQTMLQYSPITGILLLRFIKPLWSRSPVAIRY